MLRLLLTATVLVAVVALACNGDGDEAEQTPEPTASGTAEPISTRADEEPRTGIPEIDAVLDAVESNSVDTFRPLFQYEALACVQPQPDLGGPPPCRDGEAVGTTVTAIRISTCETQYVREDEIEWVVAGLQEASTYAVYTAVGEFYDYVVLLSHPIDYRETPVADEVRLLDGRVTHVNFTCVLSPGVSPEDVLAGVPGQRILLGPLP